MSVLDWLTVERYRRHETCIFVHRAGAQFNDKLVRSSTAVDDIIRIESKRAAEHISKCIYSKTWNQPMLIYDTANQKQLTAFFVERRKRHKNTNNDKLCEPNGEES